MTDQLKKGDAVTWKSRGATIAGHVVKKILRPITIKSHQVTASPEHPEYLVRSDKTQQEAAHHASALHKTQ